MTYKQWALQELGLIRPQQTSVTMLKEDAQRRGRRLLGKYHPDRDASAEALAKFRALNEVLQTLDSLAIPQEAPMPRISVSVNFYPEAHPSGPVVETQTVRRSYFDFQSEQTQGRVRYDAKRVVPMRPGKKC